MSEYDDMLLPEERGNDYDQLIAADQAEQRTQLRTSLMAAAETNPDQYAEAQRLSKATGIPAPVVARNQDTVAAREFVNRYDELLSDAPALRASMADPEFAKIAHDDIDNAKQVEQHLSLWQRTLDNALIPFRPLMPAVAAASGPIMSGIRSSAAGGYRGVTEFPAQLGAQMTGLLRQANQAVVGDDEATQNLAKLEQWFQKGYRDAEAQAQDIEGRPMLAPGKIEGDVLAGLKNLYQNAPITLAALVTRNPMAGALLAGGTTELQSYAQGVDAGLDPASATAFGIRQGAVETATEVLPFEKLLKDLDQHAGLVKTLLHQAITEIPGEMVATALQGADEFATLHPDQPISAYLDTLPAAERQTVIATLIGVAGNVTVGRTLQSFGESMQGAQRAARTADMVDQLNQLAAASKILQRNPETFQAFADAATAQGAADVYVKGTLLQDALQSVDPATVPTTVLQQLPEAVASGGDVKIPLATYAAQMAAQPYAGQLVQHLRADPADMSLAEAQVFMQEGVDRFQQQAEAAMAAADDKAAWRDSTARVEQHFAEQLAAANRFRGEVNQAYAKLPAAFYSVLGAQLGITPEEALQRFPLQIVAQGLGDGAMDQITREQALETNVPLELPTVPEFAEAVRNTRGAEITPEGLKLDLTRYQKPEQEGAESVRTGVFYLPTGSRNTQHYRTSPARSGNQHYGGPYDFKGETLIRRPLFVKGGTGGNAPETAYVALKGKEALKQLDADVMEVVNARGWMGRRDPEVFDELIRNFLTKYGADPGTANEILRNSQQGNQLRYALQENAIAHAVRAAGHDAVVGYTKGKAGNAISEVFDVRETTYPAEGMDSQVHPDFYNQSVYHGSPHRFERYDLGKIGTGEGAQVYGWGIYFADSKGVAKSYRQNLSGPTDADLSAVNALLPSMYQGSRDNARQIFQFIGEAYRLGDIKSPTDYVKDYSVPDGTLAAYTKAGEVLKNAGALYAADIPDEAVARMLDWDKPMKEQPVVFEALKKANIVGDLGANWTGQTVYELLAESRGKDNGGGVTRYSSEGQRKASEAMAAAGVPGLRYLDQGSRAPNVEVEQWWKMLDQNGGDLEKTADEIQARIYDSPKQKAKDRPGIIKVLQSRTRNTVVWDQALLDKISDTQQTLYQNAQDPRGQINLTDFGNTISLLKNADLSTFIHELGHHFLDIYERVASAPGAPESLRKDFDTLLQWFGVPDADTWHNMTLEEKRSYHEQFARGFEAYAFEGKAPSNELRSVFSKFRAWLLHVYKSLASLNVQLSDEVRGVMDRMLASSEEIQAAERTRSFVPMFATAAEAAMSPEQFKDYLALDMQATEAALEQHQAQSLRNMKWLSNARSKFIRAMQKEADAKRREIRSEVRTEVMAEPVYRATAYLRSRSEGPPKVEKLKGVDPAHDSLFTAIKKLGGIDADELQRTLGLDDADMKGLVKERVARRTKGVTMDTMRDRLMEIEFIPPDHRFSAEARASNDTVNDLEERILKELGGEPVYHPAHDYGQDFVKAQLLPAYDPSIPGPPGKGQTGEGAAAGRLTTGDVMRIGGEPLVEQLRARGIRTYNEGIPVDAIAEPFGFSSGDEMLKAIAAAEPMQDKIEGLTDQRMLERHGELVDQRAIERAADQAVHNEARGRFIATELRALTNALTIKTKGKEGRSENILLRAAKEFAERTIAAKRIRDVRPNQYAVAGAKAAKASEDMSRKGKTAEAVAEKRNQLINFHAEREATTALEEVEKGVAYLKRVGDSTTIDVEFLDQIHQLLERYDLRAVSNKAADKRTALAAWIKAQQEAGNEPVIDEKLASDLQRKPYRELTVEEFRGLVDAVKNIEHLGRLKHKLLSAQDAREFAAAVSTAVNAINDNAKRTIPEEREHKSWRQQVKRAAAGFLAEHRKLASIIRQMDGFIDGGPLWDLFVRPMNAAGDAETTRKAEATTKLAAIYTELRKAVGSLDEKQHIPAIGTSLSREARLAVALNWGNETNRQRVLGGEKWTPQQAAAVLDTLDADEWKFVRSVWSFINEFWPEIAAKERRVTGVVPEKVQAAPFMTKHGEQPGGYYPIKYDPLRSTRAEQDEIAADVKAVMQGIYARRTTRRDHTKQRAEEVNRPLRLDLGVITQHVEMVVHDLMWHEYLIDANRLLRNGQIQEAIRSHYGSEVLKVMRSAIDAIAAGDVPAASAFERSMNYLRHGATIAGLGWNLTTSLMQPLGLTQSMVRIGPKWVGRGIAQWIGDAARMEHTVANIYEKSEFMRTRGLTQQREVREIRNRVGTRLSALEDSYFYLIQKMQLVADVPTWLGAYEKAFAATNDDAKSVAMADQAVIDAQGSGHIKDLADIQRGGPLKKLWTNFYSFFNTTFNLTAESARGTNWKKPADVGKFAVDMLLLYTVPAALGTLLTAALKGDDKDLWKKLLQAQASYALGTMVGVREIGGAAAGAGGYEGPAGTRFFSEIAAFLKQLEQGKVDEALIRTGAQTLGILFHLPTGQIERSIRGFIALQQGKTHNPTAVLAGPPPKK